MIRQGVAGALALLAGLIGGAPASAGPADPVRAVLDASSRAFESRTDAVQDYFSAERLATLYSKDFVARYKAAAARAEGSDQAVLERDMITYNFSGGCPFKDLKIDAGPTKDGVTEVHAAFLPYTCMEGDPIQSEIRTVTFIVRQEDGREVIDDIIHTFSTKYAFDRYERL